MKQDFQLFDIHHGDVYVYVVAFSQDGQWALSGGFESTARFWNVATGKAVDFDLSSSDDDTVRLLGMPP